MDRKELITILEEKQEVDSDKLALEMLPFIGDLDPHLRDELIYGHYRDLIENKKISPDCSETLMVKLKDNLLYEIDSHLKIFSYIRSFSNAVLVLLVENYSFSEECINDLTKKAIESFKNEHILTGYSNVYGWCHTVAHSADLLCALIRHKHFKYAFVPLILQELEHKISVGDNVYVDGEPERLANIIYAIDGVMETDYLISFITSMKNPYKNRQSIEHYHSYINMRGFLMELLFHYYGINDVYCNILKTLLD